MYTILSFWQMLEISMRLVNLNSSKFTNIWYNYDMQNISTASNPLGFNSLSNMTRDMVEIYKEFEVILLLINMFLNIQGISEHFNLVML